MANFIQPEPAELIAAITARGFKVERAGDGWRAQCPAHDGTGLNLAIDPGRNGAALVTCHSRGCEFRDVMAALDLSNETPPKPSSRKRRSSKLGRVVAEYPYCSEDGSLAYTKVRYEPKDFRFRQPSGAPGLPKDCTRWPYRVEQWAEAPEGADLWIVEGEKDVHAIEDRLGLRATCNDGGAGNWPDSPDFNRLFYGFRVLILPDNDAPGKAHARDVASKLSGFAESVVMLKPVPRGNDVTDFVESYRGMKENILADLNADSRLLPNPSPESGFSLMSLEELMSATDNVTWLVQDMLTTGGLSLLVAKPKCGKSTLARCLALAVARGETWLDRDVAQGNVIYVALEDQRAVVRDHFQAMGLGDKPKEPIELFIGSPPKDALDALAGSIRERSPALVIVDPMFRLVTIKDGNDYAEVTRAFQPLLDIARESGAHVMCVHHARKGGADDTGDEVLGSTALLGSVDCMLSIKRNGDTRLLSTIQRHGPDMPATALKLDPETLDISVGETKAALARAEIENEICALLSDGNEAQTATDIQNAIKRGKRNVASAINALVSTGKITRTGEGKRGNPFKYENSGLGSEP